MITTESLPAIELIPINRIKVPNPRARNKKIFKTIVDSIAQIGLKRPITVTRRDEVDDGRYALVCGQGRLEAFRILGQTEIPAIVVDANSEDCMVMSLVENLARRQHRAIDLLHDIEGMKRRGYNEVEVARKTGLTPEYVRGVTRLIEKGEQRLLNAVEAGIIPLTVAVDIADTDDANVQQALQHAYENNLLRGKKLLIAKKLVEQRQRRGKGMESRIRTPSSMSSTTLLRVYQQDTEKKRMLIRRADVARNRLIFVVEALRTLFGDRNFVTLLRAEGLDTVPRKLAQRMRE